VSVQVGGGEREGDSKRKGRGGVMK